MKKTIKHKPFIHVGDVVKILVGKDKGKIEKVIKINKKKLTVTVANCNIATKHISSRSKETAGKIIKIEQPMDISNVMMVDTEQTIASRVGYQFVTKSGVTKKVRFFKKTGTIIE